MGVGFLALAILSKSVAATLPATLLVVAWWRRGRVEWKRDVWPLLPWFGVAFSLGLLSAWVEIRFVGAQGADFALAPVQRLLLAGRVPWFYLAKIAWPGDLVFIYPRWVVDASDLGQYLYPWAALLALAGLWLLRNRSRAPLAVALLFVGSLFPVLGFFNVYGFLFSYVANHWQYHQAIPVIAGLCAALTMGLANAPRWLARGVPVLLLSVLATLSWRQAETYHDLETLYRGTLASNPRAWMAHNNLGTLLLERGDKDEALGHFLEAIALKPTAAKAHGNVANILREQRRFPEARAHYAEAVKTDPAVANIRNNYASLLRETGQMDAALAEHAIAVELEPDRADFHNNFGVTLRVAGRLADALVQANTAVQLDPRSSPAQLNLALLLSLLNRKPEAAAHYAEARRLNPALPAIEF